MVAFVDGFVDCISDEYVEGWIYVDDLTLASPTEVQILVSEQLIGTAKAEIFRKDLLAAGYGSGDYAFHYVLPMKCRGIPLDQIKVRAILPDGNYFYPNRSTVQPLEDQSCLLGSPGKLTVEITNRDHSPIFILGAARSGTSALAQCLLANTDYVGHQEGHFVDFLAHYLVLIEFFYSRKGDELSRDTMIKQVPREMLLNGMKSLLIQSIQSLYPTGKWIEKTPNSNIIYVAPILKEIWPNSKFVYLQRRAIENLLSRRKKFQNTFVQDCTEWAECAKAWFTVKDVLGDNAITLEQYHMARDVHQFVSDLAGFLGLTDVEQKRIEIFLSANKPQQTCEDVAASKCLEDLGLSEEELHTFKEICGQYMDLCGYSYDAAYFNPSI